jgi:murein DD-endopeptidase MepM/ murein hydrolase activator NlpD
MEKDHKKKSKIRLILPGVLAPLLFLFLYSFFSRPAPMVTAPERQLCVTEGVITKASTLYHSFLKEKIPIRWIDVIIPALKPYVDFKRVAGGTYRFTTDMQGEMVRFIFEKGPIEVYKVEREPQGYVADQIEVPLITHLIRVEGEICSSLFEAVNEAGEQDPLTLTFAGILAWEIDFYKDLKKGDRFKVLVEKIYKGDQFIQYGPVYALEYQSPEKIIRGFRYRDDYYDERGNSLRKAFLRAPLRFDFISSRFSRARQHPILGGSHPHLGVDYAAPIGTPVWAVADGRVVSVGWAGGFGRRVILRHANGSRTYYGHLSRFGPGIKRGSRVSQKQIVGFVGSTGLSTGPHLDYRFSREGQFRNPLKEIFPQGHPIDRKDMEGFAKRKKEILAWLDKEVSSPIKVEEVTSALIDKNSRQGPQREK